MSLEDTSEIKKTNITNLKKQLIHLNEKIIDIQEITKTRWDDIDKVINIFMIGILLSISLNLVILYLVAFL
jgi:hypothetical protein